MASLLQSIQRMQNVQLRRRGLREVDRRILKEVRYAELAGLLWCHHGQAFGDQRCSKTLL
jgi:hypothetical protein